MRARWLLASAGLLAAGSGCSVPSSPPELMPSQFVRSRPAVGPNPIADPVDQNGALQYGELHAPLVPDPYSNPHPYHPTTVSPLVKRAVPGPDEGPAVPLPATRPTTAPAIAQTNPAGAAGGYEVVGIVIETVNGTPIYADQVLRSIDAVLAADARKYPPDQFRFEARNEILKKVEELQAHYVEIAAATKYLAAEDKTQAEMMARYYRGQLISAAGGSLEEAKQRALEQGHTLEEVVEDRYNLELVRLYLQKRIVPKIHVTAEDMRRYYRQHVNEKFTQAAQAKFRLIKIDIAKSGGIEAANQKAQRVLTELKAGTSFAKLAGEWNDDPLLKRNGGDEGWVNKGDFAIDKVEAAVWALQPGEYTDHPIAQGDTLYLAQLEARKGGVVKPFDSEQVQMQIHELLSDEQFRVLHDQVLEELNKSAVVYQNAGSVDSAVEMAMQGYSRWASAR